MSRKPPQDNARKLVCWPFMGIALVSFVSIPSVSGCKRLPSQAVSAPAPKKKLILPKKEPRPIDPKDPEGLTQIGSDKVQPAKIGQIEFGAFAGEAGLSIGLDAMNTTGLDDNDVYGLYRKAVHDVYGVNLSDMNYFSVGKGNWVARVTSLKRWLLRSGQYGDPTIALEPMGDDSYAVFKESEGMRKLKDAFAEAKKRKINVWVRFASECNLKGSVYSITGDQNKIDGYRRAVVWFKKYMPDNVKLVFSPLIDTPYLNMKAGSTVQAETLRAMYIPNVYSRIGGTLYASSYRLDEMYDWYYSFMTKIDPNLSFQLCELGGPFKRKPEILGFIVECINGKYPKLEKINLFARHVNARLEKLRGPYGYLEDGQTESYLKKELFLKDKSELGASN